MLRGWALAALLLSVCFSARAHAFGRGLQDARPDAASALLTAFQPSCNSVGSWTSAAQSQGTAIVGILEALKATKACQPFQQQLTSFQGLSTQLQSAQADPAYAGIRTTQEQLQLLLIQYQNTTPGSPAAATLLTSIQGAQQALTTAEWTYSAELQSTVLDRALTQGAALSGFAQGLLTTSSPTLGDCLRESPLASIELATNLISFGGTFLSPVYGASVAVLSQLINTGLELLQNAPYEHAIRRAEEGQMPDAIGCALQSMSEFYCSADDSYRLLELARENRDGSYLAKPLWHGTEIAGREMPALLRWLDEIKNGVPPTDPYQAQKQIAVLSEVFQVESINLQTIAGITDAINNYNASTDPNLKNPNIINGITSLACSFGLCNSGSFSSGTTTTSSPFSSFQNNAFYWACWIVNGYGDPTQCPLPDPSTITTGQPPTTVAMNLYVLNKLLGGGAGISSAIPKLIPNWQALDSQVESFVNIQFARTITTNASALVSEAFEKKIGDPYPISPREALQNVSDFIDAVMHYPYQKNPRLPELLSIKKKNIDAAIAILDGDDDAICKPDPAGRPVGSEIPRSLTGEDCYRYRLVKLFEIFDLKDNSQVFSTDIDELVSDDLQNRFDNGDFPTDVDDILKSAGVELWIRLQSAGLGNLEASKDDLDGARADTETNLRAFREFFVHEFTRAIAQEHALSAGEPETGPNRPHGEKLGHLCTWWLVTGGIPKSSHLTSGNWPDAAVARACRSAAIYSGNDNPDPTGIYKPGIAVGELEKRVGREPFEARVCEYHKYWVKNQAETIAPKYARDPSQVNQTPSPAK